MLSSFFFLLLRSGPLGERGKRGLFGHLALPVGQYNPGSGTRVHAIPLDTVVNFAKSKPCTSVIIKKLINCKIILHIVACPKYISRLV